MPIIIKNFSKHYEHSDCKKVKEMKWLSLPIKFDGLKFRRLMKMSDGMEILGVWIVLLQLSAKMPTRGTLANHDGDLTLEDINLMTDCPLKSLKKAINVLSSKEIGWIQKSSDDLPKISHESPPTLQDTTGQNNTEQDNTQRGIFNEARKLYPGTKRGNETEFGNFAKKFHDYREALPILVVSVQSEIEHKKRLVSSGQFCPEWKNFQTWINNRCWEQEFEEVKPTEHTGNIPRYVPPVVEKEAPPTPEEINEWNEMKSKAGL